MKRILGKISFLSEQLEKAIVCFGIMVIMLNSTANALGRYIFGKSIFFSEELNQFLIVSVTFIGFAYAVRKGRNIRMTALYDYLSHRSRKLIATLIALTTSLVMFYLCYEAYLYVFDLKNLNRLSPALQFPVYAIYSIIPIGFGIAGMQYLISFLMNLTRREIYLSYDVIESERSALGDSI